MKNISFDNPYLLLLAIPLALAVIIPFLISRNKDNRTPLWTTSLVLHVIIIALIALAAAGISTVSVLTKTTVYVLADVSYSSDRNLDQIDEYVAEIKESLPVNTSMGVVCFGKNCVVVTPAGRTIKSVSEAKLDNSATDIAGALTYTEGLFKGDTLKRIILITDGNDTVNQSTASLASTVERLTASGIKIDAIFLDNTLSENECEVQLMEAEFSASSYIGHTNEAKFLIRSSAQTELMLELYARPLATAGASEVEFEKIDFTVISAVSGLATVRMPLPNDTEGTYEYKAVLVCDGDISEYNNTQIFTQNVVKQLRILLVTGDSTDVSVLTSAYGTSADIDSYVIGGGTNRIPFTLEDLIVYDEIILSNVDIRDVKNANAFIDSVDTVVSQYGKSLITMGDLQLQTNAENAIFQKLGELLPVKYGASNREGKLYTIVLDISHSMFMASKFTIARDTAINLLSVLDDDDYVSLVTFSGEVKTLPAKKVKECRQELVEYISSLSTDHGTDIGRGLEEALKAIRALNLSENQIMLISDGFSFESTVNAVDVAKDLYAMGATLSAVTTYIPAEGANGRTTMRSIVNAGQGGNYYEISTPEQVFGVVFGQMAGEVGDAIVYKDSAVAIKKYKDGIIQGISKFPTVSGYIVSLEKYDATVPLTVTYVKANGYQETVPLYAYRSHGNGRVATLTTSFSDGWTKHWTDDDVNRLLINLLVSNTPRTRVEYPFTVNMQRTEYDAYIEIVPGILDPAAKTTLRITYPNGRSIKRELAFDSQKYFYSIETEMTGLYRFDITYQYDESTYTASTSFYLPYLPEYNAFAVFDKFSVYEFMRGNGSVNVDEIPDLTLDKNELTTYQKSYAIPLLIAAIVLFVIDVLVRKLRIGKRKKAQKRNA